MRCHYLSDLHLESQSFRGTLPHGDVLIIAGDLCHASALDPAQTVPHRVKQRERVLRFVSEATASFRHVLLVPGNHEHYDGVFEDTATLLRRHLPGVTVLDNEMVDIDGVRFFGTTLWTDLDRRSETSMEKIRRGMGEYFFAKTRSGASERPAKLRPADTLAAHDRALSELRREASVGRGARMVVITHHAPSPQGLNPQHKGNGLDGAFASDLEDFIASLSNVPVWIHGHTHIRRRYRIGGTTLLVNCCGFIGKDLSARKFSPDAYFDL
ncbi:metallophosphoesterase [Hyphomicrobium sp.]|uniref:metallophosphoesterase n=1 Tax=Hyphomicrobium sp. TaxID=82 RepID=UPI0025C4E9E8|nr:metallophosphoesterase [Hyphomicrobium sp.]MCC7252378.1 metallophosphoesterase [Hyphomicrobium sp.]